MQPSHGRSPSGQMKNNTTKEPTVPRDTRSLPPQAEPPPPVESASQLNQPATIPRRPTFHELHQTPIRILVAYDGDNSRSFVTHEELLCYHSRFFQHQFAFKREDQTNHILEDVHPDEFAIFYRWIESKQLFETDADRKEWKMSSLATLHNTAMRIEAPMFSNVIMEAIHDRIIMLTQTNSANRARKFDSSLKTISWIANNVPLSCHLYHYARDYMAYFYMLHAPELKCEVFVELPSVFVYNLMLCLRDGIASLSPITGNRIVTKDVVRSSDIEPFKKHFVDMIMVLAGGLKGLIKAHPNTKYAYANSICDYHVHEHHDPPSRKCLKKPKVGFWEDASELLSKNQVQVIE